MTNTSTILSELEVIGLGEDGGSWFVRGTENIDVAIAAIVKHLHSSYQDDPEVLGMEIDALLTSGEPQLGSHWYWHGDPDTTDYLELRRAEMGITGYGTFGGMAFGIGPVNATRYPEGRKTDG
jgi:hypothetical protein